MTRTTAPKLASFIQRAPATWAFGLLILSVSLLLVPQGLVAQAPPSQPTDSVVGGVGQSGMDQGEASVASRSDVQVSVESGVGTHRSRLEEVSKPIQDHVDTFRGCYQKAITKQVSTQGMLTIDVRIAAKSTRLEPAVVKDTVKNESLTACMLKALKPIRVAPSPADSLVHVNIELANSAAHGVAVTTARREAIAAASVKTSAAGELVARGATGGREVSFEITGDKNPADKKALASMETIVKERIGGLLDCRRKAAKKQSPKGEIVLNLQMSPTAPKSVVVESSTVVDPKAATCATTVVRKVRAANPDAIIAGSYKLKIYFADIASTEPQK